MKKVNINIWDDYLDGSDTYMYIEENVDEISFEKQEKILELIINYINLYLNIDSNIIFELLPEESECRPEIIIRNLSSLNREILLDKLQKSELSIYFNIYSES